MKNNIFVRIRFNIRGANMTPQHISDVHFQLLTTDSSKPKTQPVYDLQVETIREKKENCLVYPTPIHLRSASSLKVKLEFDRHYLRDFGSFSLDCMLLLSRAGAGTLRRAPGPSALQICRDLLHARWNGRESNRSYSQLPGPPCPRTVERSVICSLNDLDVVEDDSYHGDIESTILATCSSHKYKTQSSPKEATSASFSGCTFKMEEERNRTRRLQEDKGKLMGLMNELGPKVNLKYKKCFVANFLAEISVCVEEFSTYAEEIRTMLESLDSETRQ